MLLSDYWLIGRTTGKAWNYIPLFPTVSNTLTLEKLSLFYIFKLLHFDANFTQMSSYGSNGHYVCIGSDNDSAPRKLQSNHCRDLQQRWPSVLFYICVTRPEWFNWEILTFVFIFKYRKINAGYMSVYYTGSNIKKFHFDLLVYKSVHVANCCNILTLWRIPSSLSRGMTE